MALLHEGVVEICIQHERAARVLYTGSRPHPSTRYGPLTSIYGSITTLYYAVAHNKVNMYVLIVTQARVPYGIY